MTVKTLKRFLLVINMYMDREVRTHKIIRKINAFGYLVFRSSNKNIQSNKI